MIGLLQFVMSCILVSKTHFVHCLRRSVNVHKKYMLKTVKLYIKCCNRYFPSKGTFLG